jgi:uncharacterized membrane protein
MDVQATARESQFRSILKAITYRITGTITTAGITYWVTGEMMVALAVGGVEPFVKIIVYYVHERLWQHVPIGTIRRFARWRDRRSSQG